MSVSVQASAGQPLGVAAVEGVLALHSRWRSFHVGDPTISPPPAVGRLLGTTHAKSPSCREGWGVGGGGASSFLQVWRSRHGHFLQNRMFVVAMVLLYFVPAEDVLTKCLVSGQGFE